MSTDLQIKGTRYDLEEALGNPRLNILSHMNKKIPVTIAQIRTLIGSLNDRYRAAEEARKRGDENAPSDLDVLFEIYSDDAVVEAWRGLLWLARTTAGERGKGGAFLTLDEAADDIGYQDIVWVNDGEDDAEPVEEPAEEPVVVTPGASPVRAVGKGRRPASAA